MSIDYDIRQGQALDELRELPDESAQTCVTSPPYWGLRDYDVDGQLGLEDTPEKYVDRLVGIFQEVRRVLADDGTLWLNLGDSYANKGGSGPQGDNGARADRTYTADEAPEKMGPTLKPKDLVGIPWRVAFALQEAGWWLRSDIIWHKPNPMPESVQDRPTSSHEHIFLLAKSEQYFYDADAIGEPLEGEPHAPGNKTHGRITPDNCVDEPDRVWGERGWKNKRNVWEVTTKPYPDAHFAVYPPDLIEPCILAGSAEGDTVLDPFAGSGTTGAVAARHGRDFVGIELNDEYIDMANCRIAGALEESGQLDADSAEHVDAGQLGLMAEGGAS